MADLLSSLCWWFATAWAHACLLYAFAMAAERVGLLNAPSVRQAAWRGVVIVPVLSATFNIAGGFGSLGPRLVFVAPVPVPAPFPSEAAATGFQLWGWPALVGAAWCAFALLALARLLLGMRAARAAAAGLSPIPVGDALSDAMELGELAGLRRMDLRRTADLVSPSALLGGVVVLPDWTAVLTRDERRAVLAHEVAHLRRGDPLWRGVLSFLSLALLMPFRRQALGRLAEVSEHACDAWAASVADRHALLRGILACAEMNGFSEGRWAAVAASGSPLIARGRLLASGELEQLRWGAGHRAGFLAGAAAAALVLPGWGYAQPTVSPPAAPAGSSWEEPLRSPGVAALRSGSGAARTLVHRDPATTASRRARGTAIRQRPDVPAMPVAVILPASTQIGPRPVRLPADPTPVTVPLPVPTLRAVEPLRAVLPVRPVRVAPAPS